MENSNSAIISKELISFISLIRSLGLRLTWKTSSESGGKCFICEIPTSQKCSHCTTVFYCGREHQLSDWKHHKTHCPKIFNMKKILPPEEKNFFISRCPDLVHKQEILSTFDNFIIKNDLKNCFDILKTGMEYPNVWERCGVNPFYSAFALRIPEICSLLFDFYGSEITFHPNFFLEFQTRDEFKEMIELVLKKATFEGSMWDGIITRAVKYEQLFIFDIFYKRFGTINHNLLDIQSIFSLAIGEKKVRVVSKILSLGIKFKESDLRDCYHLALAIESDSFDIFKELIEYRYPVEPCPTLLFPITPLSLALFLGKLDFVEPLLKSGADPYRLVGTPQYKTELVFNSACRTDLMNPNPTFSLLTLLIKYGFDLNKEVPDLEPNLEPTFYHILVNNESSEQLWNFLINNGADFVNYLHHSQSLSLFHLSAALPDPDLFRFLLEIGANIRSGDPNNHVLSSLLARKADRVMCEYLIFHPDYTTDLCKIMEISQMTRNENSRMNQEILMLLALARKFSKESPLHCTSIPEEIFQMILERTGLQDRMTDFEKIENLIEEVVNCQE